MSGRYSSALRRSVLAAPASSLGVRLANACIQANLPAALVSQVLGVTRVTVHNWFRGGKIKPVNVERIEALMHLIDGDMKLGVLPAKSLDAAYSYLNQMTSKPLKTSSGKPRL